MVGRFFRSVEDKKSVTPTPNAGDAPAMKNGVTTTATAAATAVKPTKSTLPDFVAERVNLHRYLLDKINLGILDTFDTEELHEEIRPMVRDYVRENNFPLNAKELEALISDITDEMLGLGPIEPLLADDSIADILIKGHQDVYIERAGVLEKTEMRFKDEAHLLRIVNKIVAAVGRRVDESSPLVDARLADGSRVNVAIRPVAVDGPQVSIRKFSKHPYSLDRLVKGGALAQGMADLLAAAVRGRVSIVISGGTGSGKTTMLNALSAYIPMEERLVTIEDAAELQLQQPHVVRLETRPPTLDGRNEVRQRELLKNALRMRPDRIIVGEVRGEEAFDMLQAVNTGHEGSMTTVHANSPRDAISRLEQMVGMAGMPMTQMSVRSQIASAISLFVQVQRLHDGTRRVVSIAEVTGMESDVIQLQEIMKFQRMGVNENNQIQGEFRATGIRPRFLESIGEIGVFVDNKNFDPSNKI